MLLILRVTWITCEHRICNPKVKKTNPETCFSRKPSDENARTALEIPLQHLGWLKSGLQQVQMSLLAKMSSAVLPASSTVWFCMQRWQDWEGANDGPGRCVAGQRQTCRGFSWNRKKIPLQASSYTWELKCCFYLNGRSYSIPLSCNRTIPTIQILVWIWPLNKCPLSCQYNSFP